MAGKILPTAFICIFFAALSPARADVEIHFEKPNFQDTLSIQIVEGELCKDSILLFSAQSDAMLESYQWTASTGQTGDQPLFVAVFTNPGVYTVELEAFDEEGNALRDTLELAIEDCGADPCDDVPEVLIEVQGDTCVDSTLVLSIQTEAALLTYQWINEGQVFSEDSTASIAFAMEAFESVFFLGTDADGCIYSATAELDIKACLPDDCELLFPGAFTPNGDGRNDRFRALFNCRPPDFHLRVFNRWGQLVYETRQPDDGWDGSFNERPTPSDVFAWTARYRFSIESEWRTESGEVTLLR
jgi:gliding motility-associated-like protein